VRSWARRLARRHQAECRRWAQQPAGWRRLPRRCSALDYGAVRMGSLCRPGPCQVWTNPEVLLLPTGRAVRRPTEPGFSRPIAGVLRLLAPHPRLGPGHHDHCVISVSTRLSVHPRAECCARPSLAARLSAGQQPLPEQQQPPPERWKRVPGVQRRQGTPPVRATVIASPPMAGGLRPGDRSAAEGDHSCSQRTFRVGLSRTAQSSTRRRRRTP
jgi:hypothetical protein